MSDQFSILDNLFDGLYLVTYERKITFWNQAAEEMTGYSAEEMVGTRCYDSPLKHVDRDGNDLCRDGCPLTWAMSHRCKHEDDIFLRHRDGHRVPINVRVSPTYDSAGRVDGAAELFRDNTPTGVIAERIAELESLTMIDPLTQLANEKYISEQVAHCLKEMKRFPVKYGVALFWIDNTENLVKEYGQEVFDELQVIAGQTLKVNCRSLDLFARLDNGLFLGIFRNVTSNLLDSVCEKLRLLFAKGQLTCGEETVTGTFSVGGLCLCADDSYEEVLGRCRDKVQDSRQQGGNRTTIDIHFVAR